MYYRLNTWIILINGNDLIINNIRNTIYIYLKILNIFIKSYIYIILYYKLYITILLYITLYYFSKSKKEKLLILLREIWSCVLQAQLIIITDDIHDLFLFILYDDRYGWKFILMFIKELREINAIIIISGEVPKSS